MPDKEIDVLSGALAASICPGCREFDEANVKRDKAGTIISRPCPYFDQGNFYYDQGVKRFHCRLWEDNHGRQYPEKPRG